MSLYHTGSAKVGDYTIEANEGSYALNPNTAGSSQAQAQKYFGEQALDWMLLNSIQNTQNEPHYGLDIEKGGNDDESLKTLMTDLLGLSDVTQNYYKKTGDNKPVATILTGIQTRFENGYQEVISINPNAILPGRFPNSKEHGDMRLYMQAI